MAFNTRELGLLQGLTELVSVTQNHLGEDKAKQEFEGFHLPGHTLNPGLDLGVCCGTQGTLPQQLDVVIVCRNAGKRLRTNGPPGRTEGSDPRSITTTSSFSSRSIASRFGENFIELHQLEASVEAIFHGW